jgi:hypothetical protein
MRNRFVDRWLKNGALVLVGTGLVACTATRAIDRPDAVFVGPDSGVDAFVEPDVGFPDPMMQACQHPGSTIGHTCRNLEDCQDGCFCNGAEQCMGGMCVAAASATPCDDHVPCTVDACVESTGRCFHQLDHGMCSDHDACNGYELCDPTMGCVSQPQLVCNDDSSCTLDTCDAAMGCVFTSRDLDHDGFIAGTCGGDDCDDYNATANPAAREICDNHVDDDCDGLRDYSDPDCSPMNDTCSIASVLTLGPTGGTFSGSTVGMAANYTLGCVARSNPDVAFRFTLTEAHDVRVTVSGTNGTAVALRPFAECATGPDERCSSATPATFLHRSLPAGEWALIVSTATAGAFDLRIVLSDPTPQPPIDQCNGATLDVSAGGTFTGHFEDTADDYTLGCHGTGFPDAAYRFTVPAGHQWDVQVTGSVTDTSGTSNPYLQLTSDCTSSTGQLACTAPTATMLRRRSLGPGTYYLLLEPADAAARDWSMTVTFTDPPAARNPGDACGTAIDITPAGAGTTGMGSTTLASQEYDGGNTCGATTGSRDTFFHFHLAAPQDVALTTSAGSAMQSVSLETSCGVGASELACRTRSSPYSQIFHSLAAGDYWVTVTTTGSSGTVSASITLSAPTPAPANDTCAGPTVLAYPTDSRPTDTLIGFADDLRGGACGPSGMVDAFYTFTLPVQRHVILAANTVPSSTRQIVLTVRGTCGAGIDLLCTSGMGAVTTPSTLLDPGTYTVMVEMAETAASDFRLDFATLP